MPWNEDAAFYQLFLSPPRLRRLGHSHRTFRAQFHPLSGDTPAAEDLQAGLCLGRPLP